MRRFLKKALALATILSVILMLLAWMGRSSDPLQDSIMPLITWGYPLIMIFSFMLLLIYVMRRSRWALLIIASIVISWTIHRDSFQVNLSAEAAGEYTVMSYNPKLFGYYSWGGRAIAKRDSIIDMLAEVDADVLCFQEFYYTTWPTGFKTKPLLQARLGPLYEHEKYTHAMRQDQYFGVVTLSKFPIVKRGFVPFKTDFNNYCIYSDIAYPNGDTIRVFNTHMASLHMRKDDYDVAKGNVSKSAELWRKGSMVLSKVQEADRRRSSQIRRIMAEVDASPYPVILAGDFNAPPFSYAYYKAAKGLDDSFVEKGSGLGNTYNGPFPSFRIDHIFTSADISVRSHDILRADLSDHYPVIVTFDLP